MRRSGRASTAAGLYAIPEPDSDEFMDGGDTSDDDQARRPQRGGSKAKAAAKAAATGRRSAATVDTGIRRAGRPPKARQVPEEEEDDSLDLMQVGEEDDQDAAGSEEEASSSGDDDDDEQPTRGGAAGRGRRQQQPAAAAAAAAPKPRGRPRGAGSKKARTGGAATDVTQLLPSGMDEELLRSTWLRLPQKNRTHKDELMQGYRRMFPRWRLQLRCGFDGSGVLGGRDDRVHSAALPSS